MSNTGGEKQWYIVLLAEETPTQCGEHGNAQYAIPECVVIVALLWSNQEDALLVVTKSSVRLNKCLVHNHDSRSEDRYKYTLAFGFAQHSNIPDFFARVRWSCLPQNPSFSVFLRSWLELCSIF